MPYTSHKKYVHKMIESETLGAWHIKSLCRPRVGLGRDEIAVTGKEGITCERCLRLLREEYQPVYMGSIRW
jgi:hypothetical protein